MSRLILSAVGLWVTAGAVAAAEPRVVTLVNPDTGKVLAVAEKSGDAGAKVVAVKPESGDESQQWKIEKDGDHYKVTNKKSGKVLDVAEGSSDEGAEIIVWDAKDEDTDNQRWAWDGEGKARRVKAKSSGLVLTAGDDGKVVQKKADGKNKAQVWEAVEVKDKK